MPEKMERIGARAFSCCSGLREITIPEGITAIETRAFYICFNLRSIRLPSTLKAVEEQAFESCTSLGEVNLPYGTEKIGYGSFGGCDNLRLTIPETVNEIKTHHLFFSNRGIRQTVLVKKGSYAANALRHLGDSSDISYSINLIEQ